LTLPRPTGSIPGEMTARTRQGAGSNAEAVATGSDGDSDASQDTGTFESSLESLEEIVDRLEEGDLPLETALEAFEAGVSLARRCAAELDATERRIEVLVEEGGQWLTRPFEEGEEGD
jgi:exodeoxyribonuclease VII small subunit